MKNLSQIKVMGLLMKQMFFCQQTLKKSKHKSSFFTYNVQVHFWKKVHKSSIIKNAQKMSF